MALAADNLLDRIRLKTQVNRWRVVAIAALAFFFIALIGRFESTGPIGRDAIARISIEDIILENRDRDTIIKQLADNGHVKAVIMHINSPGGSIVGGETLYDSLQYLASKKPLVAVMGSVAASGGYMAALPANRVFSHEGTITGSIGVMLQTAEITGLAKKLGVNMLTFKSAPLKGTPSPFEALSPEARQAVDDSIQSGFGMFVDMVAKNRKMTKKEVLKLADGRIYTGLQAVKNGLVDAIGGEDDARTWLDTKYNLKNTLPVKDISLTPKKNRLEDMLSGYFEGGLIESFGHSRGLMTIWKPGSL